MSAMTGSKMDVKILGIVGAGPMGAGIAQTALASGLSVILFDLNRDALSKARDEILGRLARLIEKGQLPAGFAEEADQRPTLPCSTRQTSPCTTGRSLRRAPRFLHDS